MDEAERLKKIEAGRKAAHTRMTRYTAEQRSEISRRAAATKHHPLGMARMIVKRWDTLTESEKIEVKTVLQQIFR